MAVEKYRHDNCTYFFEFEPGLSGGSVLISSEPCDSDAESADDKIDFTRLQRTAILGRDARSDNRTLTVPASIVQEFVAERLRDQLQFEIENMPTDLLWKKFSGAMRVKRDPRVTDAQSK